MKTNPDITEAPATLSPAHTPGPWTFAKGKHRIEVRTTPSLSYAFSLSDEANARLISAAPDMFAELERTEASLTAILCSRVIDSTTSTWLELRRNRDAIRAAIAKARG